MAYGKPDLAHIGDIDKNIGTVLDYIRQNASPELRSKLPKYSGTKSVLRIGEMLSTNFGLWNEWSSVLMNEVGLKVLNSMSFQNYMKAFQKGQVPYGEIIEEIFVQIPELRDFSVEKAAAREFKRTQPNIQAVFHLTNFEGQYAVTIEHSHVNRAFTSERGVADLITRILSQMATAFEVDDRDLTLYSAERRILDGAVRQEVIPWDDDNRNQSARDLTKAIRSTIRKFANARDDYNNFGVLTASNPEDIYVIMDADTEAEVDVELLAHAFNTSYTDIAQRIIVIDEWDSVKEDRFKAIREATDNMVEFSEEELDFLASGNIKALVVDKGFFQIYNKMLNVSQAMVHNGQYTNHFMNIQKVYGISPFHNAVVFTAERWSPQPDTFTYTVTSVSENKHGIVTVSLNTDDNIRAAFDDQIEANVENGVAIVPQGGILAQAGSTAVLRATSDGQRYSADDVAVDDLQVGTEIVFVLGDDPVEPPAGE